MIVDNKYFKSKLFEIDAILHETSNLSYDQRRKKSLSILKEIYHRGKIASDKGWLEAGMEFMKKNREMIEIETKKMRIK
jgi:hypothetical protein